MIPIGLELLVDDAAHHRRDQLEYALRHRSHLGCQLRSGVDRGEGDGVIERHRAGFAVNGQPARSVKVRQLTEDLSGPSVCPFEPASCRDRLRRGEVYAGSARQPLRLVAHISQIVVDLFGRPVDLDSASGDQLHGQDRSSAQGSRALSQRPRSPSGGTTIFGTARRLDSRYEDPWRGRRV